MGLCTARSWGYDCYEPGSAAAACQADVPQSLPTGFERDWLTTFWAMERKDGCAIPFATIGDIWASANPVSWGNGDAKAKLLEAAPRLLEGAALDCFAATLSARIR